MSWCTWENSFVLILLIVFKLFAIKISANHRYATKKFDFSKTHRYPVDICGFGSVVFLAIGISAFFKFWSWISVIFGSKIFDNAKITDITFLTWMCILTHHQN